MEWYKDMNSIEFVSNVGRHFRMGTMLLKQSVQTRVNSDVGMSFTEFAYQIFQSYDWMHLFKNYNCRFQVNTKHITSSIFTNIINGKVTLSVGYTFLAKPLNQFS